MMSRSEEELSELARVRTLRAVEQADREVSECLCVCVCVCVRNMGVYTCLC